MKTIKKLTAILLSIAVLTALFILPAAAEDNTDAAAEPIFVTVDDRLFGIDFSAVIQDDSTIHTGNLVLLDESGNDHRYARFDEKQSGVAVFGFLDKEGVFFESPFTLDAVDHTFCLRPENEADKLYDNVGSFTFSMHDICANAEQMQVRMYSPDISVVKADGDTIYEMTLDFGLDWSDAPMLLDCVDTTKALTLCVSYSNMIRFGAVLLQPKTYDAETGVLTVSVRNEKGQEGAVLFDCGVAIDGLPSTYYTYELIIPDGLFYYSRNERIRNANGLGGLGHLRHIGDIPVRIVLNLHVPSRIVKVSERLVETFHSPIAAAPFAVAFLLFHAPSLVRASFKCLRSLQDYGVSLTEVNWLAILFGIVRSFTRSVWQ